MFIRLNKNVQSVAKIIIFRQIAKKKVDFCNES